MMIRLFYYLRVHYKLWKKKYFCIPSFCKICGRDVHDFHVSNPDWDAIESKIKHGSVLCYDCFCEITGKCYELKEGDMIDYLEVFRQQRERFEAQWDIDVKNNSKSSFDAKTFFSEDGMSHCFNAKKYTFEEACELVKSEYGSDFINVSKSYVRHRCGTTEDGKRCGWWCGDDERGYHSVPVWMFCDDEDYTAIEVALAKVGG